MQDKVQALKRLLQEASDLQFVGALMYWDQSTYMPSGGAEARGRQSALMARLTQERATDPAIGRLLDELEPLSRSLPYDSLDAAFLRAARRNYDRLTRIPADFVAELAEHQSVSFQAWAEARPQNNFARVRPHLEKTLDLSRRLANYFPGYDHIADPLIDFSDYGLKAADVRRVFEQLREQVSPIIRAIQGQSQVDDSCLRQHFPKEKQLAFSEAVIRDFGYDFNRGRMDLTHHPFTTEFSIGDVRITTRVKEDDLSDCLFSVLHEAGHGMHAQGADPAQEGLFLNTGVSAGISESQSRTWENIVGRSRGFWEHYYPKLQAVFPEQLGKVDIETFYRAVNKVQPSLIRTDSDEVTYNLHPLIRFELELALLEGSLEVKDLPEAWNAHYKKYLGITPPDDRDGVMQDVHWYGGVIGGVFQGYTLGNILSVMFYQKALEAHPEIPAEIRQGKFETLHAWLKDNLYWHGDWYTASELVKNVTGGTLDTRPLIAYYKQKYGEIYHL